MRKIGVFLIIYLIVVIASFHTSAIEVMDILLSDIINKKEAYINRDAKMILRFKNFDSIYDKIIFYDRKNYDIAFDISKDKDTKFRNDILNLHEGLKYIVVFTLKDIDDFGNILADLISFKPLILFKIPAGSGE